MTEHTPGAWHVAPTMTISDWRDGSREHEILNIIAINGDEVSTLKVAIAGNKADACLIAAAPLLLETWNELVAEFNMRLFVKDDAEDIIDWLDGWLDQRAAAIADVLRPYEALP